MIRALIAMCLLSSTAFAQNREEKVRDDKTKVEAAGYWIYNDVPKAFAAAKASGKPIIAVLRCLPCEECVKLDDELIDADATIKPLLEKFVRVRVVSTNGLDLSLFQFDTDQSFAVFFFNADGTIYGRFGTRSHRKNWIGDVSVEGLGKAMEGALELHKDYPANKADLAGKRGPAPEYVRPELFPTLKDKYKSTIDYAGKVVPSCIHCHQIGDAMREAVFAKKERLPVRMIFPYPHPKSQGLIFDPKERATLLKVEPLDAGRSGFQAGDVIRKLGGQPLLSIADVQWVLHHVPLGVPGNGEEVELKAEILRAGQPMTLTLKLAENWRYRDDISWRASTWGLRRRATGGIFSIELTADERAKLKLTDSALRVEHVGQNAPHNLAYQAGVRKGDVIVSFDGTGNLNSETALLRHMLQQKKSGDPVEVVVLRDGNRKTMTFKLP